MNFAPTTSMAAAILVLLFGYWARDKVGLFRKMNLPPPILGALAVAFLSMGCRMADLGSVTFSFPLQTPLMIGFFTALGFGASFRLLRSGGPQVLLLLLICSVVAVAQGLLGAGIARLFGLKPLLGVLAGTVTLSGGPATGLAFASQFEAAGVHHAAEIATATAMAGIVLASVFGSPIATWIIERRRLGRGEGAVAGPGDEAERQAGDQDGFRAALRAMGFLLAAMWLGGLVSSWIQAMGVTLPAYIGAMLVAVVLRGIDDATGSLSLPHREISFASAMALSLFLVMAMMSLDLTVLCRLALPLLVNLVAQFMMMMFLCVGPVWYLMGKDYDAAVASGGVAGFMLGTTANAMAIMYSLVERYGMAPRAFLAVPLVGTFLLDFTNALIITTFLNVLR
jgi:ESS family glutamate:Na+ symporter